MLTKITHVIQNVLHTTEVKLRIMMMMAALLCRSICCCPTNSLSSDLRIFIDIAPSGGGGELMTTFGDLGNYVNGFTCSPHEI